MGQQCTFLIWDILLSQLMHALGQSSKITLLPKWIPEWNSTLKPEYQTGEAAPNLSSHPLSRRGLAPIPAAFIGYQLITGRQEKNAPCYWIAHVKLLGFPFRYGWLY